MAETTKLHLLKVALQRFGLITVAAELRAPPESVDLWSRGMVAMPDRKVLPLIDLLSRINKA